MEHLRRDDPARIGPYVPLARLDERDGGRQREPWVFRLIKHPDRYWLAADGGRVFLLDGACSPRCRSSESSFECGFDCPALFPTSRR